MAGNDIQIYFRHAWVEFVTGAEGSNCGDTIKRLINDEQLNFLLIMPGTYYMVIIVWWVNF